MARQLRVIMKKLQLPQKKKKRIFIVVLLLAVFMAGVVLFISSQNNLSEEQKKELAETEEVLKAGAIKQTINTTTLQEINSSISAGKNQEAKDRVYELLVSEDSMTISERRSAYTALSRVCPALKDFECLDRVIQFQKQDKLLDYFFVVAAGRLARENGDADKSKVYYTLVYQEIEKLGGEEYVVTMNQQTQAPLDYAEIKLGAGQ